MRRITIMFALVMCVFVIHSYADEAIDVLKIKAHQGDAEAQFNLGSCYHRGEGVPRDEKEAAKWARKAADQGHAEAQFTLGASYAKGEGVSQDKDEATKWYRKAADQGHDEAQYCLGLCYYLGEGVPMDKQEGAKWFRKAADQGHSVAQFNLGVCYDNGAGVSQDKDEAAKWFRKAADQGGAEAQYRLGLCYSFGIGVPRDEKEAAKWYRKAADQGRADAQRKLGLCYALGRGVIKDVQSAYGWLLLASAGGDSNANGALNVAEAELSPAEQRVAREWAKKWKPQQPQSQQQESDKSNPVPTVKNSEWTSTGSGFFISSKGVFITAAHVVLGASRVVLNTKEGPMDAKIIALDPINDVAILKVSNLRNLSFPSLAIQPRPKVQLGQTVFTVGFPNPTLQGISPKFTKGEISSLTGMHDDVRAYQVSMPVQSGSSGGVLADEHANAVGIVVNKLNTLGVALVTGDVPQNVNYALKISYARVLIDTVPELSDSLTQPLGNSLSFEEAIEKVKGASALVLSYGQPQD
jgi:TPR repeat protein